MLFTDLAGQDILLKGFNPGRADLAGPTDVRRGNCMLRKFDNAGEL